MQLYVAPLLCRLCLLKDSIIIFHHASPSSKSSRIPLTLSLKFQLYTTAMDWDFLSREIRPLLERAERFDSFLSVITRNLKDRKDFNTRGISRLPYLEAINGEKLSQVCARYRYVGM